MNDIRILIPWHELSEDAIETITERASKADAYNAHLVIQTWASRPITHEDIRSCLRMPDEWTEEQRKSYFDKCNRFTGGDARYWANSNVLALTAIDIALRLAPVEEHKPCPLCGGKALLCGGADHWQISCEDCMLETRAYRTEADAWAAWDRRADEKAPSVAPKLDPWEEMDRFVKDTDGWGDTRLSMIWEELKKAEGK